MKLMCNTELRIANVVITIYKPSRYGAVIFSLQQVREIGRPYLGPVSPGRSRESSDIAGEEVRGLGRLKLPRDGCSCTMQGLIMFNRIKIFYADFDHNISGILRLII